MVREELKLVPDTLCPSLLTLRRVLCRLCQFYALLSFFSFIPLFYVAALYLLCLHWNDSVMEQPPQTLNYQWSQSSVLVMETTIVIMAWNYYGVCLLLSLFLSLELLFKVYPRPLHNPTETTSKPRVTT